MNFKANVSTELLAMKVCMLFVGVFLFFLSIFRSHLFKTKFLKVEKVVASLLGTVSV